MSCPGESFVEITDSFEAPNREPMAVCGQKTVVISSKAGVWMVFGQTET